MRTFHEMSSLVGTEPPLICSPSFDEVIIRLALIRIDGWSNGSSVIARFSFSRFDVETYYAQLRSTWMSCRCWHEMVVITVGLSVRTNYRH